MTPETKLGLRTAKELMATGRENDGSDFRRFRVVAVPSATVMVLVGDSQGPSIRQCTRECSNFRPYPVKNTTFTLRWQNTPRFLA